MTKFRFLVGMFLLTGTFAYQTMAADPLPSVADSDKTPPAGTQAIRSIAIHVTNEDNQPIADVLITPWALRSSQGHGWWDDDDKWAKVGPKAVRTDEHGAANISYPYYRDVTEATRTTGVSITVDHPQYALPEDIEIEIPLQETPFEIDLKKGATLDVRPTIDGTPIKPDNVKAFWSDIRSYSENWTLEKTANAALRLPPMMPQTHSVLLANFEGDRVSHLSRITYFDLKPQDNDVLDVPLKPVKQIKGMLDASVPRPVKNGRVQARTIDSPKASYTDVGWMSWAAVESDGSFTIEEWPQDESIQLIALCDGFIGKTGDKPAAYERPYNAATDGFQRPQCFDADAAQVTIAMEPLVQCVVRVVDTDSKPVSDLEIASWPNVCWWNDGSQIYCEPGNSVRSADLLKTRKYQPNTDKAYNPFTGHTDADGQVVLYLPQGSERVAVMGDEYELPINLGQRHAKVQLTIGEITRLDLDVQLKGTEKLGDWDKLAGVVFGCSTREGRRICALPEVRAKMEEFELKFRDAKNRKDPALLADAYTVVSQAFANAGDRDESLKWAQRALEQSQKAAEPAK
jgi:hypothetical protein